MSLVGAVAIGRNEGDRLRAYLESLVGHCSAIVYVDSGSDDSVALARSLGVEVVDLDRSLPFLAARARNAGFDRLLEVAPGVAYVQFVDGDCEIVPGWLDRALQEIAARPEAAVVCGRRRERYPKRSIYNHLADLEWDTPVGETEACGGDAMMRVSVYREVGGFDSGLIAGEEPELCLRLRRARWRVFRLDAEMTRHDLDMTRFGQWWRRQVRGGYASQDVTVKHRGGPFKQQGRRARVWTVGWVLALAVAGGVAWSTRSPIWALAWAIVASAPLAQAVRIAARVRRRLPRWGDSLTFGALIAIGKWAEVLGQLRYVRDRLAGRRASLIEYRPHAAVGVDLPL